MSEAPDLQGRMIILRRMSIPFLAGLLITVFIWTFRNFFPEAPLFLINLAGILGFPGDMIVLFIVALIAPQYGWQALHGVDPYDYCSYLGDLIFYSFLFFLFQSILYQKKWQSK
jgi:hypothetical protein